VRVCEQTIIHETSQRTTKPQHTQKFGEDCKCSLGDMLSDKHTDMLITKISVPLPPAPTGNGVTNPVWPVWTQIQSTYQNAVFTQNGRHVTIT